MSKNLKNVVKKGLIGFNVFDKGTFYAVSSAYSKKGFAFVQTTLKTIDYFGMDNLLAIRKNCEKDLGLEIFMHLDHGNKKTAEEAVKKGYNSVMIDCASLSLEKNIKETKLIAAKAHKKGMIVEAEVGELGGYSSLEDAEKFVDNVDIDLLAVSIGSKHGIHKGRIDVEYLKRFKNLGVPLVLHGASILFDEDISLINRYGGKLEETKGLKKEEVKRAFELGVRKANMDSTLRLAYMAGMREALARNPSETDARKIKTAAEERVRQRVEEIIREIL